MVLTPVLLNPLACLIKDCYRRLENKTEKIVDHAICGSFFSKRSEILGSRVVWKKMNEKYVFCLYLVINCWLVNMERFMEPLNESSLDCPHAACLLFEVVTSVRYLTMITTFILTVCSFFFNSGTLFSNHVLSDTIRCFQVSRPILVYSRAMKDRSWLHKLFLSSFYE